MIDIPYIQSHIVWDIDHEDDGDHIHGGARKPPPPGAAGTAVSPEAEHDAAGSSRAYGCWAAYRRFS